MADDVADPPAFAVRRGDVLAAVAGVPEPPISSAARAIAHNSNFPQAASASPAIIGGIDGDKELPMETQQRSIVWEWCDRPGIEHLLLALDGDGSRADGIVWSGSRAPSSASATASPAMRSGAFARRRLPPRATAKPASAGSTTAGMAPGRSTVPRVPTSAPCTDIDIMGTPFTNTMPIRRLALPPEQPVAISVVYVSIPDLAVSLMTQDYTRRGAGFRYRSPGVRLHRRAFGRRGRHRHRLRHDLAAPPRLTAALRRERVGAYPVASYRCPRINDWARSHARHDRRGFPVGRHRAGH